MHGSIQVTFLTFKSKSLEVQMKGPSSCSRRHARLQLQRYLVSCHLPTAAGGWRMATSSSSTYLWSESPVNSLSFSSYHPLFSFLLVQLCAGLHHGPEAQMLTQGKLWKALHPLPQVHPTFNKEFHCFIPFWLAQCERFLHKKPRKIRWKPLWFLKNIPSALESPLGF